LADQVETGDASPPSELGEDASVEIHRPKPVHSWRELATEVGVIVIGITIALGGEQALTWLHRRAEVNEAHDALRAEIALNAMAARINAEAVRCYQARFDQVVAWANGGPHPPVAKLFGANLYFTGNWEGIKGGAAAHMPLKDRLAYSQFYDLVETSRTNLERFFDAMGPVGGEIRSGLARPVNPQRLLTDVSQARNLGSAVISNNALAILQSAKAMGVEPSPVSAGTRENLTAFCSPVGITPFSP
jgi:hypothetical protein